MSDKKSSSAHQGSTATRSSNRSRGKTRKGVRGTGLPVKGKTVSSVKLPPWLCFTAKVSTFTRAAKALSDALKEEFGPEVSISQFEKAVGGFGQMTEDQKKLLSPRFLAIARTLYMDYSKARQAREDERDSFRSFRNVQVLASGLEAISAYKEEGKSTQ